MPQDQEPGAAMMLKLLVVLAAVMLCCHIPALHAVGRNRCQCLRTIDKPIPVWAIKKIELTPISGHCRQAEIIITRRNGHKVCVDPDAMWVNDLIRSLQKRNETSDPTSLLPAAEVLTV